MQLPNDEYMLLSVVNTKLRDFYKSLDELSKSMCVDKNDIIKKLGDIGYIYNALQNRFCQK